MSIVYLLYIVASALKVDQYKSGSKVYFLVQNRLQLRLFNMSAKEKVAL